MLEKLGICYEDYLTEEEGEVEYPHMMYDPKTGKEYKANTYDDHIRMKKMGYVHEKPKMKENRAISFTNFRTSDDWGEITKKTKNEDAAADAIKRDVASIKKNPK